jgi:metallo-beta-lactamase class B
LSRRSRLWILLALVILIPAFVMYGKWRDASNKGGQKPAEPFRIAGNLYYVGANDVAAFLITGPAGHVLIDGGYPGTPPLILSSIAQLGFDIRDVKILLNSHPHSDHAGGLAALQKASGAQLWVSEASAPQIESGGANDPFLGRLSFVSSFPIFRFPRSRVSRTFGDGDTIRLGPIALTAHITPGHTPGCTTFTFPVREGDRELQVVHRCSLTLPPALYLGEGDRVRADFARTFRTLRSLPVDIWVTDHAREFGRYRKFLERGTAADSAAPFIDREGFLQSIDKAERRLRSESER